MPKLFTTLSLLIALTPSLAQGQESCQGTCVASEDMDAIIEVLKERQCLDSTKPNFDLDPVNVIIDKDGRVFFSGAQPHPYTVHMKWCNYSATATGKVNVLAATNPPPTYGFRIRPKAFVGYLLAEPFRSGGDWNTALDAGVLVDFAYFKDFSLNTKVGFRSFGAGVGFDIFKNFGGYAGYAVTWDGFRSNPEAALWFAFW